MAMADYRDRSCRIRMKISLPGIIEISKKLLPLLMEYAKCIFLNATDAHESLTIMGIFYVPWDNNGTKKALHIRRKPF